MGFFRKKSKPSQTSGGGGITVGSPKRGRGKESLLVKSVPSSDDADFLFDLQQHEKHLQLQTDQVVVEEDKQHRLNTDTGAGTNRNRIRRFRSSSRVKKLLHDGDDGASTQDGEEAETTKEGTMSPSPELFRFKKRNSPSPNKSKREPQEVSKSGRILSFPRGSGKKKKFTKQRSASAIALQPPPQDEHRTSQRRKQPQSAKDPPQQISSPAELNHEPETPPPEKALKDTNQLLKSLSFQGSVEGNDVDGKGDDANSLTQAMMADDQSIEILTPDAQRNQLDLSLQHPLQQPQNTSSTDPHNASLSHAMFKDNLTAIPSPIDKVTSPIINAQKPASSQQRFSDDDVPSIPSRDPPTEDEFDEAVDLIPVNLAPGSHEPVTNSTKQQQRDTSTRLSAFSSSSSQRRRQVSAVDELLGEDNDPAVEAEDPSENDLVADDEEDEIDQRPPSRNTDSRASSSREMVPIRTYGDTRTVGTETLGTYRDEDETYDSRTQNSDGTSLRQEFRQVIDDTVQKVIDTFRCHPNLSAKQVLANPTNVMSLFYDRLCTPLDYDKDSKRPYFNEAFTREWLHKMTTKGINVLYLQSPHSPGNPLPEWKGRAVQLMIATGSTGNLVDIQPKLEWSTMAGGKSNMILTTSVPLLKIHSIMTTSGEDDDDMERLSGTFLTITSESGDVHMFEANSVVERDDILNGLQNVITRLSFHLITGDATASVELYKDDDGLDEGELPSLPNPRLNMNRIAHALLDG